MQQWETESPEDKLQRLAAIVEFSDDAIISKDLDGIVTSWNQAAERIYGYRAEEILGKSKSLVIPPELPDELSTILRRVRHGEKIDPYDTTRIRKDGTLIPLSITVSPVKDRSGRIVGASTIARDITERLRVEEALQSERSRVLALNGRLRNTMKETHHRVGNNLQLIAALAELRGSDVTPVTADALKRIGTQVRALAAVHEVLTTEADTTEDAATVEVRPVLDKVARVLRITSPGVTIHVNCADLRLSVRQGSTLAVITTEVAANAMARGAKTISIRLTADAEDVNLEFTDDGRAGYEGVPSPVVDHVDLNLAQHVADWDLRGSLTTRFQRGKGQVVLRFPISTNALLA